jgi:hypothetical protein
MTPLPTHSIAVAIEFFVASIGVLEGERSIIAVQE